MSAAPVKGSMVVLGLGQNHRNDDRNRGVARGLIFGGVSASRFFFGIALVIYLASSIVNLAMIQAFVPSLLFAVGRMGALALLLLSELLDAKRAGFAVWAAAILLPLGVVVTYLSDLSGPFMILVFVWSSRRIPFEFSAKCALWTIVAMCAIVWISWWGGRS